MSYLSFWHLRETAVLHFHFTPTTPSCTQEGTTARLTLRSEEQPGCFRDTERGRQMEWSSTLLYPLSEERCPPQCRRGSRDWLRGRWQEMGSLWHYPPLTESILNTSVKKELQKCNLKYSGSALVGAGRLKLFENRQNKLCNQCFQVYFDTVVLMSLAAQHIVGLFQDLFWIALENGVILYWVIQSFILK